MEVNVHHAKAQCAERQHAGDVAHGAGGAVAHRHWNSLIQTYSHGTIAEQNVSSSLCLGQKVFLST